MTRLRVWRARALDVIAGRRRDDRLAEEIATHLDLLAAEHMARGLSEDDARLAARRAFGGVEPMKEAYRDQRGMPALDSLVQDVWFAARSLRRDPGFTLSTVAVLALGIGVNNMLFTILNAPHHSRIADPLGRGCRLLDDHERPLAGPPGLVSRFRRLAGEGRQLRYDGGVHQQSGRSGARWAWSGDAHRNVRLVDGVCADRDATDPRTRLHTC